MQIKPQPRVLTLWRLLAALVVFVPAFLLSLFVELFSILWIVGTVLWVGIFLYIFLFHLPRFYQNLAIEVTQQEVIVRGGVFYSNLYTIALQNIQFITISSTPLSQLFRLVSLKITMAGGRVRIPGMKREDAERLVEFLKEQSQLEQP